MRPIPDRLTPLECWPVHTTRRDETRRDESRRVESRRDETRQDRILVIQFVAVFERACACVCSHTHESTHAHTHFSLVFYISIANIINLRFSRVGLTAIFPEGCMLFVISFQ